MQLGTVYSSYDVNRAGSEPVPGFRLVQRIGRGRIGEVWKAQSAGGFQVALKLIRISEGNGGLAELRALEITRELRHPNLIVCFGAWLVGDFLIIGMELADRTLWDRYLEAVAGGSLGIPRDELLGYLDEAARGLDFLNEHTGTIDGHEQKGIQHRDIKPQNILLFGGGVKVADLGMARAAESTALSETASWSFAYSAPELFRRKTAKQSDQYALAITYCQLRGGRVPFTGCAEEVMMGHLNDPPDLSMLPVEERPAVARALAKNPSDRWPTCRAFVEALRAAAARREQASRVQDIPVPQATRRVEPQRPAVAPEPVPRVPEPVTIPIGSHLPEATADTSLPQRPSSIVEGWAAAGMLGVIGLILLGARAATLAPRRPEMGGTLQTQAQTSSELAAYSTTSQRASVDPLPEVVPPRSEGLATEPEPGRQSPGNAVALLELPDDLFAESPDPEPARPVVVARPARFLPPPREAQPPASEVAITTASIVRPLPDPPSLQLEAPRSFELRAGEATTIPVTLRRRALLDEVTFRLENAPRGVSLKTSTGLDSDEATLTLSASADAPEGDQEVRIVAAAGALQASAPVVLKIQPSLAVVHLRQASGHFEKSRFDLAIAEATEAIRRNPSLATGYRVRALASHKQGNLDAAIADYTVALRLDPNDPTACNNRGLAYREKGLYFKAIADYGEALRLRPDDAVVRYNRAMAYMYAGDDLSAIADFSKAIHLRPGYTEAYQHRADAYTRRGELDRARADYAEAQRLQAKPSLLTPIGPIGMQSAR